MVGSVCHDDTRRFAYRTESVPVHSGVASHTRRDAHEAEGALVHHTYCSEASVILAASYDGRGRRRRWMPGVVVAFLREVFADRLQHSHTHHTLV